ncbi:8519_t:CDS:2, partial [Diversispora eburnea]
MTHPGFHHPISNDPGIAIIYTSLWDVLITITMRALKGLEDIIGLSITDCRRSDKGLKFSSPEEMPGCIPDTVNNFTYIYELYQKADPKYDQTS